MPQPLYPQGKRARNPLDRLLGGSQNRSGRHGEWRNKNSCHHRDSNSDNLAVQPVDSRYTYCANPALNEESNFHLMSVSFHLKYALSLASSSERDVIVRWRSDWQYKRHTPNKWEQTQEGVTNMDAASLQMLTNSSLTLIIIFNTIRNESS
jgi:hypothetical protein